MMYASLDVPVSYIPVTRIHKLNNRSYRDTGGCGKTAFCTILSGICTGRLLLNTNSLCHTGNEVPVPLRRLKRFTVIPVSLYVLYRKLQYRTRTATRVRVGTTFIHEGHLLLFCHTLYIGSLFHSLPGNYRAI